MDLQNKVLKKLKKVVDKADTKWYDIRVADETKRHGRPGFRASEKNHNNRIYDNL